jgi:hypothetical protein
MKKHFEGEYALEEDYPVYTGYWYIVNGEPWKSNRDCEVRDLMKLRIRKDGNLSTITSVLSCNIQDRGLERSPYVEPFFIVTLEEPDFAPQP